MSEPTCRVLCYIGAGCLSGVRTYLAGTVLQGSRLYKWCRKLSTRHCVTVVQTVLAMSEPTYPALCYRGAGCISGVGTYLPGTVLHWCRLFKRCRNLPTGHCVTVVQTVLAMSEPTYPALCYSGAGCLSGVGTSAGHCVTVMQTVLAIRIYLAGTVLQ